MSFFILVLILCVSDGSHFHARIHFQFWEYKVSGVQLTPVEIVFSRGTTVRTWLLIVKRRRPDFLTCFSSDRLISQPSMFANLELKCSHVKTAIIDSKVLSYLLKLQMYVCDMYVKGNEKKANTEVSHDHDNLEKRLSYGS